MIVIRWCVFNFIFGLIKFLFSIFIFCFEAFQLAVERPRYRTVETCFSKPAAREVLAQEGGEVRHASGRGHKRRPAPQLRRPGPGADLAMRVRVWYAYVVLRTARHPHGWIDRELVWTGKMQGAI